MISTGKYLIPGVWLMIHKRYVKALGVIGLFLTPVFLVFWRPETVTRIFEGAGTGEWIAVLYLLLLFAGSFFLNFQLVKSSKHPAKHHRRKEIRRLKKNHAVLLGLSVLFIAYSLAILAPLVAPHDPVVQHEVLETRLQPPSLETGYVLGTDSFGRDVLSRIIYGARISLFVGFAAVAIAIGIGTITGLVAGYLGGWVDSLLMRFVDLMLGFPRLFLILIIIAFAGPSVFWTVTVLGLTGWMGLARIIRGETLSLREREYVLAAQALGMGTFRILFRHVLPNLIGPIVVFATLAMGNVILIEAGLSFLGLGVQAPMPSWGNMINLGREYLLDGWWISAFPGLAIAGTVITFNLVGDGLQEVFNPRMEQTPGRYAG